MKPNISNYPACFFDKHCHCHDQLHAKLPYTMKTIIATVLILTNFNVNNVCGFSLWSKKTANAPSATKKATPTSHDYYWSRPDIHTLGNVGTGGKVHAAVTPLATKAIDVLAYGGKDVRALVSNELRTTVGKSGAIVCDLCCGVGMSTRALECAFTDAVEIIGCVMLTSLLIVAIEPNFVPILPADLTRAQ
jgi:hypothetical protein